MHDAAVERADALLRRAAKAPPDRQRLLVVAALNEVMSRTPIMVGGAAEAHWMSEEYRPTDIDVCPRPSAADRAALRRLGFRPEGRHWVRDDLLYGVEFPGDGGDIERTVEISLGDATAVVISREDLYLDRLRQATMTSESRHRHFTDALALLVAQWEVVDWAYLEVRISSAAQADELVGGAMRELHPKVVARARDLLAGVEARGLTAE